MGEDLDRIDAWVAEQRAENAISGRAREAWLRSQAEATATWTGALTDLTERKALVTLRSLGGRTWRGTLGAVTTQRCDLITATGRLMVRLDAIGWLGAESLNPPTGDRHPNRTEGLAVALGELLVDAPDVELWLDGDPEPVRGRLAGVSAEVVTVRPLGGRTVLAVRLQSISEALVVTTSG